MAAGADFVHQGLRPDIAQWVTPDDSLVIGVRNAQAGVTLAAAARLWVPGSAGGFDPNAPWPISSPISGQFLEGYAGSANTITPSTDRSLGLTAIPLTQGYLVAAAVRATVGSPRHGQCLVSLYLQRGTGGAGTTYQLLGQDYVTAQTGAGWPGGRIVSGSEGKGALYVITVAQPPAGADWTQTVPAFTRWRIKAVSATLTTSAVVATRFPQLEVLSAGGAAIYLPPAPQSQAAGVANGWVWQTGLPVVGQTVGAFQFETLPPEIEIGDGGNIKVATAALQAGDQWSGIALYVEEWIND